MAFKRHLYNDIVYVIWLCNQVKRLKFHSVIPQSLSLGLLNLIFVSSRVRKQTNLGHGENKIFTFNRQDAVGLKQFGPSPFTILIIIAIRLVSIIFLFVYKENPVPTRGQPNILISSICDLRGISMCNMVC